MKFWLGVVSKTHVTKGVEGGFAQVCHGKKGPLSKMKKGDWLIYYSPGQRIGERASLKAFTAIGVIQDDDVYKFQMNKDFQPFRRNMAFKSSRQILLESVKNSLRFTQDKNWGYKLRLGLIELDQSDFEIIAEAMGVSY